jgi:hypothetical protein
MTIFKYDNDEEFFCEVCDNFIQRRTAIAHFNGKKHIDNMMKKQPKKEKITCPCGSLIRATKLNIEQHCKTIKHSKYMNDIKYKKKL